MHSASTFSRAGWWTCAMGSWRHPAGSPCHGGASSALRQKPVTVVTAAANTITAMVRHDQRPNPNRLVRRLMTPLALNTDALPDGSLRKLRSRLRKLRSLGSPHLDVTPVTYARPWLSAASSRYCRSEERRVG